MGPGEVAQGHGRPTSSTDSRQARDVPERLTETDGPAVFFYSLRVKRGLGTRSDQGQTRCLAARSGNSRYGLALPLATRNLKFARGVANHRQSGLSGVYAEPSTGDCGPVQR